MRTVLEVLTLSTDYLQKKGIKHPRRQAEELLGEALKIGRMGLYLEFDRPLDEEELDKCRQWLKRRGEGEPLQHISGSVEFMGCSIKVTKDVLIPRQETEILVDKVIAQLRSMDLEGKHLWDVCCGSGCLGIALKKHLPKLNVTLSDISSAALTIAKQNALQNEVDVSFFEGDLLQPFMGKKADFFICNPPYIAKHELETLDVEVKNYEPVGALIGGATGLEYYERLAQELPLFLNAKAKVWFEIGDGQGEAIHKLFHSPKWKLLQLEHDWAGKQRFFSLEIE